VEGIREIIEAYLEKYPSIIQTCGEDVNMDGKVNLLDLLAVRNNINSADCSPENNFCNRNDINRDEKVNLLDLLQIRNNINKDCSGRAGLEMNNEGMDNFIFKPMLSPEKKGVFEKILDFIKKIFNI